MHSLIPEQHTCIILSLLCATAPQHNRSTNDSQIEPQTIPIYRNRPLTPKWHIEFQPHPSYNYSQRSSTTLNPIHMLPIQNLFNIFFRTRPHQTSIENAKALIFHILSFSANNTKTKTLREQVSN